MSTKKSVVLLVEDDALISEAIAEALARAEIKVVLASDGEEGLTQALAHKPDMILLDLMMPKKTGHEMLEELRADAWGADVPVMVLTNATDNIDIFKATKHKNTSYAIKSSMKLEDIIRTVKFRLSGKSSKPPE